MASRAIRYLLVACAAAELLAGSAGAAYFTFAGKLTTNRGRNANVPMAGNQTCGSLTVLTGPVAVTKMVVRGVNTLPAGAITTMFNWKAPGNIDQGCVKARPALMTAGGGAGVGKAFTLAPQQFTLPYPRVRAPAFYKIKTDIPVVEIKNFPPALQLATSVNVTGPPAVRAHYSGTQGTMAGGTAMHAAFRKFRAGAWTTQTGRAAAKFTWCPPPLTMLGNPGLPGCTNIGQGGFAGIIKYSGGGNAFGGTMSIVTHQIAGVGSIALNLGGPIAHNNFGGGESLGTGRGYADYNMIVIPSGEIRKSGTVMSRYIGPILKSQKVIGMVAPTVVGMWPAGKVYDWGFPWTTMTVAIRVVNPAMTRITTFTGKGWDCAGTMQGPACSKTPTMGIPGGGGINRNISLVSGAVGISRLPPPFGDSPIANMGNMQLLVMPEPGATLQLLAGAIGLLGIAAWRWRRVR